jgi:hypothetical protein
MSTISQLLFLLKLIIIINLLKQITFVTCISSCNLRLRNAGLRFVVFKEKKVGKILKKIKNFSDIYYNNIIASTGIAMNNYNELSEDEKTIIEALISLCY